MKDDQGMRQRCSYDLYRALWGSDRSSMDLCPPDREPAQETFIVNLIKKKILQKRKKTLNKRIVRVT